MKKHIASLRKVNIAHPYVGVDVSVGVSFDVGVGGRVYFEAVVTGVGCHYISHSRSAQCHPAKQSIKVSFITFLSLNYLREGKLLSILIQHLNVYLKCFSPVQIDHLD